MKKITFLGGDERSFYTAKRLSDDGYFVKLCAAENLKGYEDLERVAFPESDTEVLVLPIPLSKDGKTLYAPFSSETLLLSVLRERLPKSPLKIGGKTDLLEGIYDITADESFKILNAVPSVEGALLIALRNTPHTLFGADCLCLGYGRLGKRLGDTLFSLGAKVSVAARSLSDLAEIRTKGFTPVEFSSLQPSLKTADIVFNTVPAPVLTEKELSLSKKDALFIDLASGKGGIVKTDEKPFGRKVIKALGLPGKTAPRSAGELLYETVKSLIGKTR